MVFETKTATVYVRVQPTTPQELYVITDFVRMIDTMDIEEWETFKDYSADKLKKEWALYYRCDCPWNVAEIEYSFDATSVTIEAVWSC